MSRVPWSRRGSWTPMLSLLAGLALATLLGPSATGGRTPSLGGLVGVPVADHQSTDPVQFTPEELQVLERRFGVHGPQPRLAQLLSDGLIDQIQPLREHTLNRLTELAPLIRREAQRQQVNPMLVAAVLFDEMRHAKPGEDLPIAAHSGLFSTHGLAQLGIAEMQKQGLLPENASELQIADARDRLLNPDDNVRLLIGKFARLSRELQLPHQRPLQVSASPQQAKALATLAYLHNGKLDYPRRILRHMQDPELHAAIYGKQRAALSPLI